MKTFKHALEIGQRHCFCRHPGFHYIQVLSFQFSGIRAWVNAPSVRDASASTGILPSALMEMKVNRKYRVIVGERRFFWPRLRQPITNHPVQSRSRQRWRLIQPLAREMRLRFSIMSGPTNQHKARIFGEHGPYRQRRPTHRIPPT